MRARGIAANSALALTGDLASKMGALAVVLLAARLLSVQEFAVVATALAGAGLLAAMLDLGTGTLLTRDGARNTDSRGALFRASLEARMPIAAAVLVGAVAVGIWIGRPLTALTVAALGVTGALALSVLGLYRSFQDVRPEALQKVAAGAVSVLFVALCGVLLPRSDLMLAALLVASTVALLPLLARTPAIADLERRMKPLSVLRRAAPLGLLALATVAYYRSGTLALALFSDAQQTAVFSVAASVAFGLLMIPNAITTALLPRLSAEADLSGRTECARRALAWTLAVAVPVSAVAAVVGPVALPLVLGQEYARAGLPFALLCAGIPVIAASGVLGTALLAAGRIRELALQVGCTLLVNLTALALLAPTLGAPGAALATLVCEAAGLALLLAMVRRPLPGLTALRPYPHGDPVRASGAASS